MNIMTVLIVVAVTFPFVIISMLSVLHAAGREFETMQAKGRWMLIAAIPFIGFIVYFLFGARKGKKPQV
jgi:uncharacterized membrane protein YhaH (DUF805 family)